MLFPRSHPSPPRGGGRIPSSTLPWTVGIDRNVVRLSQGPSTRDPCGIPTVSTVAPYRPPPPKKKRKKKKPRSHHHDRGNERRVRGNGPNVRDNNHVFTVSSWTEGRRMAVEERWDGSEGSLRRPLMHGQRTGRRDESPLREVVVDVHTTEPNEPSSTYPGYTNEPMMGDADATMRRLDARPSFSAADFGFEEPPPVPNWKFWDKADEEEKHDPKKVPVAPLADRPVPDGPKFHYRLTRMMRLADEGKGKVKVVRYKEAKLLREGFLYLWQGTIFESKFLWQQVGFMFFVASIVAGFTWLVADRTHLSLETAQSLSTISETLSTIVAFILGLYLQKTVDIWWELRHGTIQKLMNTVDNMCMRMSIYFPGTGSNDVMARKTILRYGLLSIALLFKEAREIDAWTEEEREQLGVDDLSDLVVDGMLTNSEKELLEDCGGKSQMVWVWISSLFTKWCLDGRLPDPLNNQEMMLKYCEDARNAIGTILAQLNMQFPLSYTHTVVLMTKMMLLAVAVESGFSAGVAISLGKYAHLAPPITFLIILPLIYQGLIDIKEHISNPFRDDSTDYCFKMFHARITSECRDFFKAGSNPPYGRPAVLPPQLLERQITSAFYD